MDRLDLGLELWRCAQTCFLLFSPCRPRLLRIPKGLPRVVHRLVLRTWQADNLWLSLFLFSSFKSTTCDSSVCLCSFSCHQSMACLFFLLLLPPPSSHCLQAFQVYLWSFAFSSDLCVCESVCVWVLVSKQFSLSRPRQFICCKTHIRTRPPLLLLLTHPTIHPTTHHHLYTWSSFELWQQRFVFVKHSQRHFVCISIKTLVGRPANGSCVNHRIRLFPSLL